MFALLENLVTQTIKLCESLTCHKTKIIVMLLQGQSENPGCLPSSSDYYIFTDLIDKVVIYKIRAHVHLITILITDMHNIFIFIDFTFSVLNRSSKKTILIGF